MSSWYTVFGQNVVWPYVPSDTAPAIIHFVPMFDFGIRNIEQALPFVTDLVFVDDCCGVRDLYYRDGYWKWVARILEPPLAEEC